MFFRTNNNRVLLRTEFQTIRNTLQNFHKIYAITIKLKESIKKLIKNNLFITCKNDYDVLN